MRISLPEFNLFCYLHHYHLYSFCFCVSQVYGMPYLFQIFFVLFQGFCPVRQYLQLKPYRLATRPSPLLSLLYGLFYLGNKIAPEILHLFRIMVDGFPDPCCEVRTCPATVPANIRGHPFQHLVQDHFSAQGFRQASTRQAQGVTP